MKAAACLVAITVTLAVLASPSPARANVCGPMPETLILLDRSGSMKELSGGQSKWSIAVSAVQNLTSTFSAQFHFGLMLFSRWPHVSNCSSGQVNVNVAAGTAGSIQSMLSSAYPEGDTPIALSLDSARSYMQQIDSGKPQYVLLITDGKETCQPSSVNSPPTAAGKLLANGVKTYVVGFGQGVDPVSLTATAQAGGTGNYYQANDQAQLNNALQQIAADISCCGDGKLDPGELCDTAIPSWQTGACPQNCNDNDPCTTDTLSGSACQQTCSHFPITAPKNGDGCCPPGATSLNDSDCGSSCGNGVVEPGELCDTAIPQGQPGACPSSCNDNDPCTVDVMSGSGCQVFCTNTDTCVNQCGNGQLDAGETCDTGIPQGQPGACPLHCNDNDPCTQDTMHNSGCQAYCTHSNTCPSNPCGNGVVDPGELCDTAIPQGQPGACPQNCNDPDPCTLDIVEGSGCQTHCNHLPITTPQSGDGCCPQGASNQNDKDCPLLCGNGQLDPGETCDTGIPSGPHSCNLDCSDGDPCTWDASGGPPCQLQCFHQPMAPSPGQPDGCCPTGMSSKQDADCPPPCGPDKSPPCVDACQGVTCPDGQYCSEGSCLPWPNGNGEGNEGEELAPAGGMGVMGDEGCACRASGQGPELPTSTLLLLLTLLVLRRRYQ